MGNLIKRLTQLVHKPASKYFTNPVLIGISDDCIKALGPLVASIAPKDRKIYKRVGLKLENFAKDVGKELGLKEIRDYLMLGFAGDSVQAALQLIESYPEKANNKNKEFLHRLNNMNRNVQEKIR